MALDYSADLLDIMRQDPLKLALTPSAVREFRIAKSFSDNKAPVTSLDYDLSGKHCITTSTDESLRVYDSMRGVREQVLYSKKYGCNLAQFTSQPGYVAYASTKINDTIRYLSFETNQYVRYFVGHSGLVTSLQRTPGSSGLMSAAMDGTVCLWDLEVVNPTSMVKVGGKDGGVVAAYDPSGMVVAVSVGSTEVRLYDVREITRAPFSLGLLPTCSCQKDPWLLELNLLLILAMTDGTSRVWSSHTGEHVATLANTVSDHSGKGNASGAIAKMSGAHLGHNLTVTPDGKTVLAGRHNGSVAYWDISHIAEAMSSGSAGHQDIAPGGTLNGRHDGPVSVCAFNPLVMECITASTSMALWSL
ncbi:WD40-repeat-containing domain protein [Kickxella alabastrina]|uniref:WD40-repeat-containing domain protein n=1 Tax=Kickxella alabastrina TaxID=61397 RepID=UPI00221F35E3|nr:WD40-repeat-containing domain protein [Kickxella alabastrina]KAI7832032.1 WD40-repeat-containing domain protein [Kickxella alabastrina]